MLKQFFIERKWHSLYLEIIKDLNNSEIDNIISNLIEITPKIYPTELAIIYILYTNKLSGTESVLFLENVILKLKESTLCTPEHIESELFLKLHKFLFELPIRNIEKDIYSLFNIEMSDRCKFVFNILCRRYFEQIGNYEKALLFSKDEYSILKNAILAENVYDFENLYLKYQLEEFRKLEIKDKMDIRKSILGLDIFWKKDIKEDDIYMNVIQNINVYFTYENKFDEIIELRKIFNLIRDGDVENITKIQSQILPKDVLLRKTIILKILKRAQLDKLLNLECLGMSIEDSFKYVLELLGSGVLVGYIDGRILHVQRINDNLMNLREMKFKIKDWKMNVENCLRMCQ